MRDSSPMALDGKKKKKKKNGVGMCRFQGLAMMTIYGKIERRVRIVGFGNNEYISYMDKSTRLSNRTDHKLSTIITASVKNYDRNLQSGVDSDLLILLSFNFVIFRI